MKRDQVFVRAWLLIEKRQGMEPIYRIVNCDILDLNQESFNVFIAGLLFRAGFLTGIKDQFIEGQNIKLYVADEHREKYLKKLAEED